MFKYTEQPYLIAQKLSKKFRYLGSAKENETLKEFWNGININCLLSYVPTGANDEYIRTVANSTKDNNVPVILLTAGNSTGKTLSTFQIISHITLKPQSGWFDYSLFRNFPYPKVIWYISTAIALRDRVTPEIEKVIQDFPNQCEAFRDGTNHISRVVWKNGWVWIFKTFDQDPITFESMRIGILIIDEPGPEEIWKKCKGRMTQGCVTLLPMTPLECPAYIIDEIAEAELRNEKGYFHLTTSLYSACKKRGVRGFLDPEIIDQTVSRFDEDEKKARVFGKFMYFSGKILPTLDPAIHFVDPDDFKLKPEYMYFHVVDPHDGRPNAEIWGALCPNGRRIIFDERPMDTTRQFWQMKGGEPISEHKKSIEFIERKYEGIFTNITRILDRHFGNQTRGSQKRTLFQDYAEIDLVFNPSYTAEKELFYGHSKMRDALGIMPDGKPGLVIWNNCYHVKSGLRHYIWKSMVGKQASDKLKGTIVEKYKDLADCVRMFVCEDKGLIEIEEDNYFENKCHRDMGQYF